MALTPASPSAPALPMPSQNEQLKIVIVGHVDHGKSTFVGRLFHDTGSLPEGKYEQLVEIAQRRGVPFEFANLMDSLQSERDQNITIDTAQIWFQTPKRQYVIIDAPGHKEFLKNMITGAANAHAALLLIDAHEGVREQSRHHGHLLHLLGIRQVAILVNKMDLQDFREDVFQRIETEYRKFLSELGVEPKMFIPICARDGDNIATLSPRMPWYHGMTVLQALDEFAVPPSQAHLPLRFPIQDVYRFDHRRILAGRVESGTLRVGDRLVFWPSGKSSVVNTIERWSSPSSLSSGAGESIGITLTEQIFVERGQVAAREKEAPKTGCVFSANLFWMGRTPLRKGQKYRLKLGTQEADCEVRSIERIIDASTLRPLEGVSDHVVRNGVAKLTFQTRLPVALDLHSEIPTCGRFVVVDQREVSGGGIITGIEASSKSPESSGGRNIVWSQGEVLPQERAVRNGHAGAVVWLTGLSGSGKSTLAVALERELFNRGMQTCVLDGDNLRYGLNANLGFSPEDRSENIRRAAEVAKLFASNGFIVITSLISPYRTDRARVREIMREGQMRFFEIHVECPLEVCEQRDPKKLYARARAGEIKNFTGITSAYEPPEKPEFAVHTDRQNASESLTSVLDFLLRTAGLAESGYEI